MKTDKRRWGAGSPGAGQPSPCSSAGPLCCHLHTSPHLALGWIWDDPGFCPGSPAQLIGLPACPLASFIHAIVTCAQGTTLLEQHNHVEFVLFSRASTGELQASSPCAFMIQPYFLLFTVLSPLQQIFCHQRLQTVFLDVLFSLSYIYGL